MENVATVPRPVKAEPTATITASGPVCLDSIIPEPGLADLDLPPVDPDDPRTWRRSA